MVVRWGWAPLLFAGALAGFLPQAIAGHSSAGGAHDVATNSLIIPDLQKRNPGKEFDLKFTIRRSPAHMGVKMGEHNLVRWLDSFIFFNTMNTELDKLHMKWLGRPMEPMPAL